MARLWNAIKSPPPHSALLLQAEVRWPSWVKDWNQQLLDYSELHHLIQLTNILFLQITVRVMLRSSRQSKANYVSSRKLATEKDFHLGKAPVVTCPALFFDISINVRNMK